MVGSSGLEKQEGKPARRLPLSEPPGSTGSTGVPADLGMIHRLFGRRLHRYDGDVGAALSLGTVRHAPVDQRKQRVIPAQANVFARMPFGPVLPHDDVAGTTWLAAEQLDAEALARGIAAVARVSACFLVRHGGLPSRTSAERRAGSLLFAQGDGSKRTRPREIYLLIRPGEYQVAASVAPASAFGAARRGRGGGVCDGFLPSVRISVIRTRENCWRWPRLRREFLRRRFLKAMTLGPRT